MLHSYRSPHRALLRSGSRLAFIAVIADGLVRCRSGLWPQGALSRHRSTLKRLVGFVAALALSLIELSAAIPGAPTAVVAVGADRQAEVSFTAPESDGGAAITSYTVTSSPGGLTATGTSSPITITGLTNGTSYTFTVTATNNDGPGSASSASSVITPMGDDRPTISSISPNAGPIAGGTSITINGNAFSYPSPSVTIGGIAATFTVVNGTRITATTPAGTSGPKDVVVSTEQGPSATTDTAKFNYTAGAFAKPAVRFSPAFPHALSITAPGSGVTDSASFTVTFNQSVTGVDAADFSLIATGTVANGTISSITGSGATRTVNVTGITGVGTLGLNLVSLPTITAAPSFADQVTYPTGSKPTSVTLGDVNGDGRLDLIIANFDSGTASVLLGNGNGTFQTKTDFVTGTNPQSVTLGDVNGDGRLDLITANSGSNNVSVFLGNGTGTFGAKTDLATGTTPRSVKLADVNGDGTLDIVTANQGSNSVSVLLGTGDGTFAGHATFATANGPYAVALGDVNGDGKLDIVTGNRSSSTVYIATNFLGHGTVNPKANESDD